MMTSMPQMVTTMREPGDDEEAPHADSAPQTEPPKETPAEAEARAAEWTKTAPAHPPAPLVMPDPSTIVDPGSASWAMALQPRDAADAYRMARAFYASGLYAKKFASVDAIWTVMLLGREHGLSALAALQSMTVIEGKVEMDASLIVAKILRSGLASYFSLVSSTDEGATWATRRVGPEEKHMEMSFTLKEAERRGLFRVENGKRVSGSQGKLSNWHKMPDVMCMWRAATKLARAKYPDVVRGLYGQGEIRETRLEDVDAGLAAVADAAVARRDGKAA